MLVYIFILIILIGISALCSMTETALSSVSIIRIKAKARKGDKKSIKVYRLVKKYSETVTTILIFNNIVNILSTSLATYIFSKSLGSSGVAYASTPGTTTYSAKFNPNGGKFSDGTTSTKTIKYTDKKYFTDNDIAVTRNGYKFLGWKNNSGDVFNRYIDKSDNGSTLTAQWQSNNSGGTTTSPNPDIGDETQCEYIYKDSCEVANDGYNCVKDENNCYVKGDKKQDDNIDCVYYNKNSCESAYSGYNCIQDSNGCFIKGSKKNNNSSGSNSSDPESNPNTGNSLLYLSVIIGIVTLESATSKNDKLLFNASYIENSLSVKQYLSNLSPDKSTSIFSVLPINPL